MWGFFFFINDSKQVNKIVINYFSDDRLNVAALVESRATGLVVEDVSSLIRKAVRRLKMKKRVLRSSCMAHKYGVSSGYLNMSKRMRVETISHRKSQLSWCTFVETGPWMSCDIR